MSGERGIDSKDFLDSDVADDNSSLLFDPYARGTYTSFNRL
jgi:hypothetical protein